MHLIGQAGLQNLSKMCTKPIQKVYFLSFWDAWNQEWCPGTISPFFLEFGAAIWSPGEDISEIFLVMIWSNDSHALLNYIFIRFLLIWPLLWHPFSEEFGKHTSLDFQRTSHTKALVWGCGTTLLCPCSPPFVQPQRRCTLVLFFLPFRHLFGTLGKTLFSPDWHFFLESFLAPRVPGGRSGLPPVLPPMVIYRYICILCIAHGCQESMQ